MSRADRKRIRRTLASAGAVDGARRRYLSRFDDYTPEQRTRVAHHVLACLPAEDRLEILERHLGEILTGGPAVVALVAGEISRRLEPGHRVPGRRLRDLRLDVP